MLAEFKALSRVPWIYGVLRFSGPPRVVMVMVMGAVVAVKVNGWQKSLMMIMKMTKTTRLLLLLSWRR